MSQERADKYRRKAEEYRVKAGDAAGEHDQAAWLKLAEDWQLLADVLTRQCVPDDAMPPSRQAIPR
jgi:hypothetical protein